jgi:hypothetical protein
MRQVCCVQSVDRDSPIVFASGVRVYFVAVSRVVELLLETSRNVIGISITACLCSECT